MDSAGSIYLTGSTSSANFPTTPGVFDTSYGASADVFIAKLNPAGTGLIYATFLGGSGGTESGEGIAVDGNGNAFITGYTPNCSDFPTTPGALQTVSRKCGNYDAFVTKLNAGGTGLVYSTFLSGFYADKGQGIQVDAAGNAYVVGLTVEWSGNSSFPTTPGAYDTSHNGGEDVFVVKLNPTGSAALYATFVGGTGNDSAEAIAIDSAGNAYVTGKTTSSDFPVTAGAFDTSYGGNGDAFVVD